MYNPDQYYEMQRMHIKDLYKEAEQSRMSAALEQDRHAMLHTAGRQLSAVLVKLGIWLGRCVTSSRRSSMTRV